VHGALYGFPAGACSLSMEFDPTRTSRDQMYTQKNKGIYIGNSGTHKVKT